MKQAIPIIGTALIIFIWQFLTWAALGIHNEEYGYVENQDQILTLLKESGMKEGKYFLPFVPEGSSAQEAEAVMTTNQGKPWAQIHYRESMVTNMPMNMLRGFVIDIVAAILLIWILTQFAELNMMKAIVGSLAVGTIGYLTIPYLNSIWFDNNTMALLLDTGVQWLLVGAFLGWALNRKKS